MITPPTKATRKKASRKLRASPKAHAVTDDDLIPNVPLVRVVRPGDDEDFIDTPIFCGLMDSSANCCGVQIVPPVIEEDDEDDSDDSSEDEGFVQVPQDSVVLPATYA